MGTASIHRQPARDGAVSREGFVSVSPPSVYPQASPSTRKLFTESTATLASDTAGHRTAWVEAGIPSKEPQSRTNNDSESFVEGMRRVLGSLHIKGISAEKLHRGRTPKQDAPFANCTIVLDPPLSVVIIGSGFGEFHISSVIYRLSSKLETDSLVTSDLHRFIAGFSAAIACARQGRRFTALHPKHAYVHSHLTCSPVPSGFSVVLLEKGSGLSPHGDLISFCPNANRM